MGATEPETDTGAAGNTGRGLTLGNLLMLTTFMITVMAVITPIRHAGGGIARYMLIVPSGLALGALIGWVSWSFQNFLLHFVEGATKRRSNTIAVVWLISLLVFLAVGAFAGDMLAKLILKLLA